MTYDTLRHFADTWGLLGLFAIFTIVLLFAMRPGAGNFYSRVAKLPLEDEE